MSSFWSTAKKKVFGIHELQTQKVSDRKRGEVKIKSLSYQRRSLTAALRYSKLAIIITADKAMTKATTGRLPAATPRARCVLGAPKRWVGMAELIRRWLRLALGSKPGLPRGHEPGEWSFGRGGWIVSPCARALASIADPARAQKYLSRSYSSLIPRLPFIRPCKKRT